MKNVKLIALLMALLIFAALLTACGGQKDEETNPTAALPTLDVPGGSGYSVPDPTAPVQTTKGGSEGETISETEPRQPDDRSTEGETGTAPTDPAVTQPSPTAPAPTAPDPSASVGDDSDEDLVEVTTEYPDDTDEDLG